MGGTGSSGVGSGVDGGSAESGVGADDAGAESEVESVGSDVESVVAGGAAEVDGPDDEVGDPEPGDTSPPLDPPQADIVRPTSTTTAARRNIRPR